MKYYILFRINDFLGQIQNPVMFWIKKWFIWVYSTSVEVFQRHQTIGIQVKDGQIDILNGINSEWLDSKRLLFLWLSKFISRRP